MQTETTFTLKGAMDAIIEAAGDVRFVPDSTRFASEAGRVDHITRRLDDILKAVAIVQHALNRDNA